VKPKESRSKKREEEPKLVFFSSFIGDGGYHRRCRKGEEEKTY